MRREEEGEGTVEDRKGADRRGEDRRDGESSRQADAEA